MFLYFILFSYFYFLLSLGRYCYEEECGTIFAENKHALETRVKKLEFTGWSN